MARKFRIALCVALGSLCLPASAANMASMSREDVAQRILELHNRERAAVGAPPLQWDARLAQSAATYGPALASIGRLVHSPRATRPGQRENLAMAWTDTTSPEQLVGLWVEEKRLFHPGAFPNVTRTGNWSDVAHYTQMVWKGTTHVGCAVHTAPSGWSYLICRYSPPGNIDGKPVY
jgi:hypothetical protein